MRMPHRRGILTLRRGMEMRTCGSGGVISLPPLLGWGLLLLVPRWVVIQWCWLRGRLRRWELLITCLRVCTYN